MHNFAQQRGKRTKADTNELELPFREALHNLIPHQHFALHSTDHMNISTIPVLAPETNDTHLRFF